MCMSPCVWPQTNDFEIYATPATELFTVAHVCVSVCAWPQTNDFKIRYTSIVRIWVLPKSATPHTLVVVSLDPPIRKGQTYYSHLLCQFSSTDEISTDLEISDEVGL
jgi:hypothetical protein